MAPRSEQQNVALRQESSARILEAALSLFARFGFERTSVRMIAREAGVSQGLLYNYFTGKDDLLRAIFQRSLSDVRVSFDSLHDAAAPATQLERYIRRSFEILQQHQDFWRLFYSLRMQPAVLAGLRDDIAVFVEGVNQTLTAQFQAMGEPNP
ncbi:MAG TPA: TetR/AcrR family transcriptional regulator, partial [Gemmatimonadales bacterium]